MNVPIRPFINVSIRASIRLGRIHVDAMLDSSWHRTVWTAKVRKHSPVNVPQIKLHFYI